MLTYRKGYPASHHRRRRMLAPSVAAGLHKCAYCGETILPGDPWDLGHTVDRTQSFPEHQWCNRKTATRRMRHSRSW